jgi:hypothetical protein
MRESAIIPASKSEALPTDIAVEIWVGRACAGAGVLFMRRALILSGRAALRYRNFSANSFHARCKL